MFSAKLRLSDDEDDFFGDVERTPSNLSNVFGVSLTQSEQQKTKNQSLKYVPPKQTKPIEATSETDKTKGGSVQVAKVVTAFKLVNKENETQGKLGIAVLKMKDDQQKIVLYRSKTKIVSTFTMTADAKIFIKKPYFQFRDDLQIFWSILFENEEDEKTVIDLIKGYVILEKSKDEKDNNSENADLLETEKLTEPKFDDQSHKHRIAGSVTTENNSSDERSKGTKAQILSRMAKMGQPLPRLKETTKDISDSSDTEIETRISLKPVAVPRKPKIQQITSVVPSNTQLTPGIPNLVPYSPYMNAEAQCLNMLFTENRTQNTEVRMNISKIETKIDKVLDKIEIMNSRGSKGNELCREDELLELEEKLLILKKENRTLKIKISELESDEHSTTVSRTENLTAGDVTEFNNLIEMFNVNVDEFESASELWKELLRKYDLHCSSLNSSIESYKKSLEDSEGLIDTLKLQHQQELSGLSKETIELKEKICDMEHNLKVLQDENNELVAQKDISEIASENSLDSVLKDIMNNLYQTLVTKFEENKNFTSTEVLRICGSAIKQKTNNAIKK